MLFRGSFSTGSAKFNKFDARDVILFQTKVFARNIKETTPATISDKNYGKKMLFEQFRLFTPFPLLTMLKNNEQNLRQVILWAPNII